jgi:PIN domain nuclease of toxin-antitoxin system
MIVLDTCALLWWTLESASLSAKALEICKKAESAKEIAISSISIWEIALKAKQGKLDLGISVEKYVSLLEKVESLTIEPVHHNTFIKSVGLSWEPRDPVDRTIVALATKLHATLVTKDKIIRQFYKKAIW